MDICLCASKECPKRDECYRANTPGKGVYTMSYLAEICNEESNYECFIDNKESYYEERWI